MTLESKPQPQTQLRRRISACQRHPAEPVTGICASCLRERLSRFDPAADGGVISSSSAAAAGFRNSIDGGARAVGGVSSAFFGPELRRCKSLCAGKCEGSVEHRRRSYDVRVRRTLSDLFNLDDEKSERNREIEVAATRDFGQSRVTGTVFESREEYENEGEIRVSEGVFGREENIVDERLEIVEEGETKTMKEHIDLELQSVKQTGRDFMNLAGSFRVAASICGKKLQKWQQRERPKNHGKNGAELAGIQVEKPIKRQLRDTQSEIGDYGFGRRSCDTDPRLSVDAGRMSLDYPRPSLDEARASWDGNLIARQPSLRIPPKMANLEKGAISVHGLEYHVLVEQQMNAVNENRNVLINEERQRRDLDHSSSDNTLPAIELDEGKSLSNARVSPAVIELFHKTKLPNLEGESSEATSNSLENDCSNGSWRHPSSLVNGGSRKEFKNSHRWRKVWNIWGSAHKHGDESCRGDEMCCYRGNAVDDSIVESIEKLGHDYNREAERGANGMITRSKSCVSSRNSCKIVGSLHSKSASCRSQESEGFGKRRESMLERNQIPRHSPSSHDNGLLRFYLTPLRSYRSRSQRSRLKGSRSILRRVLRL